MEFFTTRYSAICTENVNLCVVFEKDSLDVISSAMVDRSVEGAAVLSRFQFERLGYFAVDSDSTKEKVGLDLQSLLLFEVLKM